MINISPVKVNQNINNINFKGQTDNNKTHAGLKTGAISTLAIESVLIPLFHGKNLKNVRWLNVALFLGSSLGCGALIDALINNKRKKGENNNAVGKKVGTALGAGIIAILNASTLGKAVLTKAGGKLVAGGAAVGALGGFILGAITDKCANSAYRKHNS